MNISFLVQIWMIIPTPLTHVIGKAVSVSHQRWRHGWHKLKSQSTSQLIVGISRLEKISEAGDLSLMVFTKVLLRRFQYCKVKLKSEYRKYWLDLRSNGRRSVKGLIYNSKLLVRKKFCSSGRGCPLLNIWICWTFTWVYSMVKSFTPSSNCPQESDLVRWVSTS